MFARTRTAAVAAALAAPLAVAVPASATHTGTAHARDIADACPAARVQPAHFDDVAAGSTHALAIDCVAWWDIAAGRTSTGYAPGETVSRGQMATFLRNLVEQSGGTLAAPSRDYFSDDNGTLHEQSINLVAQAGIASGRPGGGFAPGAAVERAQMASFLVKAYEVRAGQTLAPTSVDAFADDNGSVHEGNINRAAAAGFVAGVAGGGYAPAESVRRDSMASFLSRVLDLLVEDGTTTPPPVTSGDFDTGFGSRGSTKVAFGDGYAEANDVVEAADGKVVLPGFVSGDIGVARLTADGTLDPSFGGDGLVTTPVGVFSTAMAGAVQPDGKIVIGGRTNPSASEVDSDFVLIRYNTDGSLDTGFSGDGIVTSSYRGPADLTELLLQPDGKILAAGSALDDRSSTDPSDMVLERYLPNGALDTAFGTGGRAVIDVADGPDYLDGLALQRDGKIVAAGQSSDPAASNEQSAATVVRLLADGRPDTTFGANGVTRTQPGPFARFTGVALQSDGSVVAAGTKTNDDRTVRQVFLTRFTPAGAVDEDFGDEGVVVTQPAPQAEAADVTVDAQDRIAVVGRGLEDSNDNGKSWVVLLYQPDGELDTTFSDDGQIRSAIGRSANAVVVADDGDLLVAGCDCPFPAFGRGGIESTSSMLVARFRTED